MAVVPPLPGNGCIGTNQNTLQPERKLKCLKGYDNQSQPVYTCAAWRRFRVQCPKINQLCNSRSEAWVAAVTVCNQHLY